MLRATRTQGRKVPKEEHHKEKMKIAQEEKWAKRRAPVTVMVD